MASKTKTYGCCLISEFVSTLLIFTQISGDIYCLKVFEPVKYIYLLTVRILQGSKILRIL